MDRFRSVEGSRPWKPIASQCGPVTGGVGCIWEGRVMLAEEEVVRVDRWRSFCNKTKYEYTYKNVCAYRRECTSIPCKWFVSDAHGIHLLYHSHTGL